MSSVEQLMRWEGPAIGLLDLDAFFASVEQLDNPALRGKPVIVGGSPDRRGVVSTASYEARRYGVHSAMPSAQARRLCPQAVWVRGNYARYQEMSGYVMDVLVNETPLVEQVSIDEAFFDVTPGRYSHEDPIAICRRIQSRVANLGVTCSIGIGTSKTVAKIASEQEKPRGLTVVMPGTERRFLAPLSIRALSGIGSATERALATEGIRTLGDLARQDPDTVKRLVGVSGPRLVARARGEERSSVTLASDRRVPKSVSNERTFSQDLTTADEVRAAIGFVSEQVGTRLRRKGLKGSLVTLKLKFDYSHTHTAQHRLSRPSDDERRISSLAQKLLGQLWRPGTGIRLVGVGVSDFGPASEQLSLFDDYEEEDEKLQELERVTDELRQRFGKDAVRYGRNWRLPSTTRRDMD